MDPYLSNRLPAPYLYPADIFIGGATPMGTIQFYIKVSKSSGHLLDVKWVADVSSSAASQLDIFCDQLCGNERLVSAVSPDNFIETFYRILGSFYEAKN